MVMIERVRIEDIADIKRVLSETWVDTYRDILSPRTIQKVTSVWHDPERLAEQAQNPAMFFGAAKEEGKIVGLVTAASIDKDTIMVFRLYVHPHFQRRGIGSDLLKTTLLAFPDAKKLRLEVEEENKKGLSFYRKQG